MQTMIHEIIYNTSLLEYRDTPWDEKVFGLQTKEILNIQYDENLEDINELVILLENKFDNDGLIYFRTSSNENILKKYLIKNGYYISETAFKLSIPKFQKKEYEVKNTLNIIEKKLSVQEISEVKEIAKTSFNYSRFHEDPFISNELCNKRYENWIDDLIEQNKNVLIFKNSENEILSFMFYTKIDEKVDLILGGSKKGYGLLTPSFFSSVILYLQKQGVKKVDVVISASNITIFNIYINLGFTIKETMFDYHKFIRRK